MSEGRGMLIIGLIFGFLIGVVASATALRQAGNTILPHTIAVLCIEQAAQTALQK